MRTFIEKNQQQSYTKTKPRNDGMIVVKRQPASKQYPYPSMDKGYKPKNREIQDMARLNEANNNNNNIFNGKNVSDNTKITSYYTLKSAAPYQSPLLYFGQGKRTEPRGSAIKIGMGVPETSKVKELFTNAVATDTCDDCRPLKEPAVKVSNLISDPQLNLKYDDAWFLQQNPQHWNNLRTKGLLKDQLNEEEDPIMALNPTLYKVVQNQTDDKNFQDPFQKIMQQQHMWNQNEGYIKDIVYRTDLDHPNSMHNVTSGMSSKMNIQFPKTENQVNGSTQEETKMTLNGYYDKQPMSLKNQFKEHTNKFLNPVDTRMYNQNENFNQENQNKLYKPNHELLFEIERTQKMREFERNKRHTDEAPLEQQVEEISPSGHKRKIQGSAKQSQSRGNMSQQDNQTSPQKARNPFMDNSQVNQQQQFSENNDPNNMFAVKMGNQSQNMDENFSQYQNDMDPNCRREMPDRNEPNNMMQQQYQVNDQMEYGEESAPRQSSNGQQYMGQESVSRSQTRSAYTHEQSTLKKQKIKNQSMQNRMQGSQDDYGEEAYGEEEDMGEDYSQSRPPTNARQDMGQSEYGDEGEDESIMNSQSQSQYQPKDGGGLEQRLEQIKQNIKQQKNGIRDSNVDSNQSIEHLENVLKEQRQRLDNIQEQANNGQDAFHQSSAKFNGEKSKEMLEFELSKASPMKKSKLKASQQQSQMAQGDPQVPGSSSVNLEKAYEELEKEILEIKQKLQNSISQNESSHDQSAKRSAYRQGTFANDGYNGNQNQAAMRGSGQGSIERSGNGQYKSMRNTRTSGKSAGKRSGMDSRSPGGTGTYGRDGNLDDPDYSLSVSELNSNLGNSLLKSAARGMGGIHPGGMMEGMSPESSLAPRFPGEDQSDPRHYNY